MTKLTHDNAADALQPSLISVEEAAKVPGIGRTLCYGLIASTALRSVQIGRRRLVVRASIDEFIARESPHDLMWGCSNGCSNATELARAVPNGAGRKGPGQRTDTAFGERARTACRRLAVKRFVGSSPIASTEEPRSDGGTGLRHPSTPSLRKLQQRRCAY
jgi:excisionase family DNA binding protein